MQHLTPSKIIELSRGAQDGPGREHLSHCPACRRLMLEDEVLRALYLEAAPEVPSALARRVKLRALQEVLAARNQQGKKKVRTASPLWKPVFFFVAAVIIVAGAMALRSALPTQA